MSTSTKVIHGEVRNIDVPVTIIPISGVKGEIHYNPGLARDNKGNLWISLRSCIYNPDRWEGWEHPMHWQNYLNIGLLDEKTLKITKLKEIKPEKDYEGFQWGLEDARLFWRDDGLHAIGVILPIRNKNYRTCQAEVLIDHEKGTYKLIKDYGQPKNHTEKNWSPPEVATDKFDFAYSVSEIYKDGKIIGKDDHLAIHNGSKLLAYKDGYIQISHIICLINKQKTYAHLAILRDKNGYATQLSQLFHLNVGWRPDTNEWTEWISDMVWSTGKEGKELLVTLGVKDKATGITRIPVDKFIWDDTTDIVWYKYRWVGEPSREEMILPRSNRPDHH